MYKINVSPAAEKQIKQLAKGDTEQVMYHHLGREIPENFIKVWQLYIACAKATGAFCIQSKTRNSLFQSLRLDTAAKFTDPTLEKALILDIFPYML